MSQPVASPRIRRIAWVITCAGVIPFAVATAFLFSDDSHVRVPAIVSLVTYSAVVLSFLGGIEWGLALREEAGNDATRSMALGLSTVPSLAAWAVLWLPTPSYQLGTALGIFVVSWAADQWLSSRGLLPSWFVDLRTAVTALVAAILGVALWKL
jgi:ABC-type proline/glycine betaine transport system permease subunit